MSCVESGITHQLSHNEKLEKCIFCRKKKEDILDDDEDFNDPHSSDME